MVCEVCSPQLLQLFGGALLGGFSVSLVWACAYLLHDLPLYYKRLWGDS